MNVGNHDNSDPMTDYFDVGWYISVNLGRWDKFGFFLETNLMTFSYDHFTMDNQKLIDLIIDLKSLMVKYGRQQVG